MLGIISSKFINISTSVIFKHSNIDTLELSVDLKLKIARIKRKVLKCNLLIVTGFENLFYDLGILMNIELSNALSNLNM